MSNSTRIGTNSFDVFLAGIPLHIETMTLEITDNSATVYNNGRPDGTVLGDVSASGELVLDAREFAKLKVIAAGSGSWQSMPAMDLTAMAGSETLGESVLVTAYGCKLKLAGILDIDKMRVEKATRTIPFEVTDPKFVEIDGIPYAEVDGITATILKAVAAVGFGLV